MITVFRLLINFVGVILQRLKLSMLHLGQRFNGPPQKPEQNQFSCFWSHVGGPREMFDLKSAFHMNSEVASF